MATTTVQNPALAKELVSPIRLSPNQYALIMDTDAGPKHLHGWALVNSDDGFMKTLSATTDPQYLLLLAMYTRVVTDSAFRTNNIKWAQANLAKIKSTLKTTQLT